MLRVLQHISQSQAAAYLKSVAPMSGTDAAAVKRRKLAQLRSRISYVSGKALEDLLTIFRDDPDAIPSGVVNRSDLRKGRDEYTATPTPYGPLHSTVQIAGQDVEVQNPAPALWLASRTPGFRPLLDRALRNSCVENGIHRFGLVLYSDEIGPGNQIAYKQARKTWTVYWAIRECGPESLMHEDSAVGTHKYTFTALVSINMLQATVALATAMFKLQTMLVHTM